MAGEAFNEPPPESLSSPAAEHGGKTADKPERLPLSRAALVWISASLLGWAVIVAVVIAALHSLDLIRTPDDGVAIAEGKPPGADAEEIERLGTIAPAAGPGATVPAP